MPVAGTSLALEPLAEDRVPCGGCNAGRRSTGRPALHLDAAGLVRAIERPPVAARRRHAVVAHERVGEDENLAAVRRIVSVSTYPDIPVLKTTSPQTALAAPKRRPPARAVLEDELHRVLRCRAHVVPAGSTSAQSQGRQGRIANTERTRALNLLAGRVPQPISFRRSGEMNDHQIGSVSPLRNWHGIAPLRLALRYHCARRKHSHEDAPLPSNRSFGTLFVVVFALLGAYWWWRGGRCLRGRSGFPR